MDTLLAHPTSHTHMPDYNRYKDLTLKTKVLSEISQNPLESVAQSYEKIVAATSDTSLVSFRNVKSTLYRQRYTMMPKTPRSIESLRIRDEWAETQDGKKFLLKIDREWGIVIFSSEWQLKALSKCTLILSDGTFKSSPKIFYQVYVIFGVFGESKIPLVWCLLQNKTTGIYRRMLQIVSRKLQRMDLQLKIKEIICDFELGFKVRYNISVSFNLDILISF